MRAISMKAGLLLSAAFAGGITATPALAQSGADDTLTGDIIVTARRSEERLQDVPISITVYSQEAIADRNVVTAADLAIYTPSLAVNQRFGPEKAQFAIRGFNQGNSEAPTVGVYFADVVAPRAQGGTAGGGNAPIGSFMDLQNVQVLKGPQGTLFGRNTTGGAVLLVPQKPTDRLEGYIQGWVGDYGMVRGEGVLNIPLADTFKVRLAVDRNKRDGYMKNHLANGERTPKSQDYNDINYFAARLSILADLTPDLENYTIATYSNSFANGYGARLGVCNDAIRGASAAFPTAGAVAITATAACDQINRQNARGDGPYDVEIRNYNPGIDIKVWSVINTTTWRASDTLTIKNIASYTEYREVGTFSLNSDNFFISPNFTGGLGPVAPAGTPFNYILLRPTVGQDNAAQGAFTEELQIQGRSADGSLNYQVGGYLEISNPIGFNSGSTGILTHCTADATPGNLGCAPTIPAAGTLSLSRTQFHFRDKGLYAQATYNLTDQLAFTGGFRYTWSTTRGLSQSTRVSVATGVQTCNDTVRFNQGVSGTGALIPLPTNDPARCSFIAEEKSGEPTWLVGVDFKPIDDLLLYGKYSRGYRAGGVNLTTIGVESWRPEFVDAYEAGAKFSFSGAVNGYFNIAGFYNKLRNAQIAVSGVSNVAGFSGAQPVINAGEAKIQGIEVDTSISPFEGLRLDAGYTFLDSELQSINTALLVPPPGSPYQNPFIPNAVPGSELAQTPKHRLTLTGTYTLPLDESIGDISIGATYTYTSRQVATLATFNGVNRPASPPSVTPITAVYADHIEPGTNFQFLPATNLVNLNVNWDNFLGQPVDLAFFVTNLTKEVYPVAVGSAFNSAGFENQLMGAPRMFGFRVKYRFGN
jgi:iron complex outermembrane recepter protein